MELRAGTPAHATYGTGEGIANMLGAGGIDLLLEYAAIATDYRTVEDYDITVNFIIGNEKCAVVRRSGVVLTYIGETLPNADATARGSKSALVNYLNGNFTGLTISGSTQAVNSLFEGIQKPVTNFNIIEP
jgi:alkyl sulfatase BDS1-like metallo-beta-lactamase superfamily hydrolase